MPRSNHKQPCIPFLLLALCALAITLTPRLACAQEQDTPAKQAPAKEEAKQEKGSEAGSPLIDLIKTSQERKSQMHSKDWDTSKYKEELAKERGQEETEETGKKTTGEKTKDEELTKSDKIWNHYNDLAKRSKTEDKKEPEEKTEEEVKTEKEEKTAEAKSEKEETKKDEEPEQGGISDILQRYKESQKKQGPMNSRSYGSID